MLTSGLVLAVQDDKERMVCAAPIKYAANPELQHAGHQVNEVLIAKETFAYTHTIDSLPCITYKADLVTNRIDPPELLPSGIFLYPFNQPKTFHWNPARELPVHFSRMSLIITDIVIRRVHEIIFEVECLAEGTAETETWLHIPSIYAKEQRTVNNDN